MNAQVTLLLDRAPAWLGGNGHPASVLVAPVGAATLLEWWLARLRDATDGAAVVIVGPSGGADYASALRRLAPGIELLAPDGFGRFVARQEPSDRLLLVDAAHPPLVPGELPAFLAAAARPGHAAHLLQLHRMPAGIGERVLYDDAHRVRAIQRVYDGRTRAEAAWVAATLLPVSAARTLNSRSLASLDDLRAALAARGVPGVDVAVQGATADLAGVADLLAFSAALLAALPAGGVTPGFELAPGVWRHPSARVHRTCRLFGPLVLHAGARLAAHAAVIGPAVVGPGAVVQEHAVVCQALVLPRATVKARGHVVRQVVSPQNGSAAPPAGPPSSPLAALAAEPPRPVRPRGWRRLPHSLARGRLYRFTKRAADTLAAFAGLVVLSPLLVFVGLLIKLTSRGPVLFVHEREGLGGRVFRCWKFRTMVAGAHAAQRALYCQNALDGPQFKLAHDPRITRLGSFLRRANIDELPQLINVVLGQMSLIGPRPSPFRENQICVSWREARLSVRPGITGLWQVCRHERQFGDFHQWIYFDLLYVRHRSLPLDVRIFLATLLTLGGRWSVPLHWMIPGSRLHAAQPLPPSAAAAAAQRVECAGAPAPRSGPVPPLC